MKKPKKTHSRAKQQDRSRWFWPFFLFLSTFLPAFWVYYSLFAPVDLPEAGYALRIERGSNLNQVVDRLSQEGVLPSSLMVKLWLRLHPGYERIQPGLFKLSPPLSAVELVDRITKVEQANRLTVVEGMTFRSLLDQLAGRQDIQHELTGKSDQEVLQLVGADESHPEGLFAPDTYDIAPGDSDLSILKRLYRQQEKVLAEEWTARAADLPYRSPYEALIMASIVEKETGLAQERPQIAGVFVRRLQIGMRLQTDPTIIYGMGATYAGKIRKKDKERLTPYNTYRINGLPPTPIALPGRAAIHAALNPAAGDSLYFVARGDGSHVFSATYDAHRQSVQQFQINRVEGYRSTPSR